MPISQTSLRMLGTNQGIAAPITRKKLNPIANQHQSNNTFEGNLMNDQTLAGGVRNLH
jgi:hypothetical protein